jgi:hypothetical protein
LAISFAKLPIFSGQAAPALGLSFAIFTSVLLLITRLSR